MSSKSTFKSWTNNYFRQKCYVVERKEKGNILARNLTFEQRRNLVEITSLRCSKLNFDVVRTSSACWDAIVFYLNQACFQKFQRFTFSYLTEFLELAIRVRQNMGSSHLWTGRCSLLEQHGGVLQCKLKDCRLSLFNLLNCQNHIIIWLSKVWKSWFI